MTNVRFTNDSSLLLTTGGADHALFQWRFVANPTDGIEDGAVDQGKQRIPENRLQDPKLSTCSKLTQLSLEFSRSSPKFSFFALKCVSSYINCTYLNKVVCIGCIFLISCT